MFSPIWHLKVQKHGTRHKKISEMINIKSSDVGGYFSWLAVFRAKKASVPSQEAEVCSGLVTPTYKKS